MGYFKYQARDRQGQSHQGVLEAVSELDAARKLKSSRLFPIKIKPVRSRTRRRIPEEHVIRFFIDLSELLTAGLPVDRALALISTNQSHKVFQRIVQGLLEEVHGGSDLSDALSKYRDIFGDLSDHMVRAGEASGTLAPILKRLGEYLEQRREFRQTLVSSMIYPLILFGVSSISVVVLLTYVIPRFAQIFHNLNQEMPLVTRILLQLGVLMKQDGWILPLLLAAGFWGGRYLYRQPEIKKQLDHLLFKIPMTRYLVLHGELTRFCRTLGTMIQTGVPLLRAINLGEQVLLNSVLRESISTLRQEIKVGHTMSNFFRSHSAFPARMGTMLRIAEEQGNLGEGLVTLADYFERELQSTLQRLVTLVEPAVIIFTGLIIGVVVISMFSAIFGINNIQF